MTRFMLLGALTLFSFIGIVVAMETVGSTDLNFARLLASATLLKEARPASDNYVVKVFSYLDERACDGDQKCNGFGVFVTFESDGELPDVVAKSVCCFSGLGLVSIKRMPNTVELSDSARLRLRVEISGQENVLDVSINNNGVTPLIKYSLNGKPVAPKN